MNKIREFLRKWLSLSANLSCWFASMKRRCCCGGCTNRHCLETYECPVRLQLFLIQSTYVQVPHFSIKSDMFRNASKTGEHCSNWYRGRFSDKIMKSLIVRMEKPLWDELRSQGRWGIPNYNSTSPSHFLLVLSNKIICFLQ